MKLFNYIFLSLVAITSFGCYDLTEVNENPNGVDPNTVNPNLVMSTVLTTSALQVVNLGFGDIAGVMQHTQKDAWFGGHNAYDWNNQAWSGNYGILRNVNLLDQRATDLEFEFHQAIALIMKAYNFGLIVDLWGPAPYTNALRISEGDLEFKTPSYDDEATIYNGILQDLETASNMLGKPANQYEGIVSDVDVIYGGDPSKWQKFANSLQLRYYMRISEKDPSKAQAGFERLANAPLILDPSDDANMSYVGNSSSDSWPSNSVYDASGSSYRRIKMCETLVDVLQTLDDPRLGVWAKPIEVPLVIDDSAPAGTDVVADGIRRLSPDVVEGLNINTDPEYVGLPPNESSLPSAYNLNPTPGQQSFNPHVSFLSDLYQEAANPLLLARVMSSTEVHFLLAEAAQKGWNVGSAEEHYNRAIATSFENWGLADEYDAYIASEGVAYDGSLEQLIQQKWISSWTAATEAWFDYRRTGLPALQSGPAAKRDVLPVRFYYGTEEISLNEANLQSALGKLEETSHNQADGKNSAWSKTWLLQGTGKPW